MTDARSIETTDAHGACFWCAGSVPSHHYVHVERASLFVLCSEACLQAKLRVDAAARAARRRRTLARLAVAAFFVAACITPHDGPPSPKAARAAVRHATAPAEVAPLPGAFGPEWPPSEASLIAELGRDAWFHPLAGPFRRMPIRDSRVFGAERPGDRPIECRKGHCGVDLGGEIWGEQVRAAHDGVVDRVQRAANELHGGHYVRLAHHHGTVFTQYFHLAAIPRWVQPGVRVKAGDVIGLLGDTGVKESAPHVHFTVSVRPAKSLPEVYIDPEPLIALWPLRIPLAHTKVALVSVEAEPGVPRGGAPVGTARRHRPKKRRPPPHGAARDDETGAPAHVEPAPETDEDAAEPSSSAPAADAPAAEPSE